MIPRFKPIVGKEEIKAAIATPKSAVEQFEHAFAKKFETDHAVAFSYGRSAFYFLLKALKIENAEILCPAYTCVVVPHVIVETGNVPVFVDVQNTDGNLDWKLADQLVSANTRAIIATSIWGHPVDLDAQRAFQEKYPDVMIIQDCAHSYAAEWQGTPVQNTGVAAIYGMNVSKIMHSIYGGMVTTGDPLIYESLKRFQFDALNHNTFRRGLRKRAYLIGAAGAFSAPGYALVHFLDSLGGMDRFVKYYDPETIELPKDYLDAMSPPEAAVGLIQLGKYDNMVNARRKTAQIYRHELGDIDGLSFPEVCLDGSTFSHIVASTTEREKIIKKGAKYGVEYGRLIEYAVPDLPVYKRLLPKQPDCPVASEIASSTINLPVSGYCSPKHISRVVKVTRKIFEE